MLAVLHVNLRDVFSLELQSCTFRLNVLNPHLQKRRLYAMSFCLLVCSSVACEICEVIWYVAAPGGEQGLIVSTPILVHVTNCCAHGQ